MASVWQDLRYALRVYRNNKSFTLMALLTLAIGIGANTALFTVVNAVLLRPLPYPEPGRITQVYRRTTFRRSLVLGYAWFRYAQRNNRSFEYLTAWGGGPRVNATAGDSTQAIRTSRVSADFFRVFGVHPVLGRDFTREDDQPGSAPAVMISHPLWTGLYGRDSNILGRTIDINGENYTVVGVMKPGFTGGLDADAWIPFRKAEDWTEQYVAYLVAGRLRPGVTMEGARQDLDLLWANLRTEKPGAVDKNELGGDVTTYLEQIVGGYRTPLLLLSGAAACILLIACVNVANLLLARAVGRRKEIAIRVALGTSRSRLIRQLLTESLLLSAVSGAAGFLLAAGLLHALKQWFADQLIRGHQISMDLRILWFTVLVSALTGIAFGLVPALQLVRISPVHALRDFGGATGNRATRRFRASLICAQISLTAAILLAAGLLLTSFQKLRNYDLGFTPQGILTVETALTSPKFQTTAPAAASIQKAMDRLSAIPGVQSVAAVNALPTTFTGSVDVTLVPDPMKRDIKDSFEEEPRQITPSYFEVMNIPMRSGRMFTEHDTANSELVAIINEAFVRKYVGKVNPVGLHLVIGQLMGRDYADQPRAIVGVATDTRGEYKTRDMAVPSVYVPLSQMPDRTMADHNIYLPWSWVIRTTLPPLAVGRQVHDEILKADPALVVSKPQTMEEVVDSGISQQKVQTMLVVAFAAIALLLAAVGLYGTMSQTVAERRQELGIRSALGAGSRDILWLMMNYSLKLIIAGLILGVAASIALQRFIAAYLFGVTASAPVVYLVVVALLTSTALAAALAPAMRATRIDPKVLLEQ